MKIKPELKAKLLAQINQAKAQCEGPREQYLQKARLSYLYEAQELPGKLHPNEYIPEGGKLWVEPVLANAKIEATPQLLESFRSEGRLAVAIRSRGWRKHTDLNELIQANLNRMILDENDGYNVITKAIDEALGPGSAFTKGFIEDISEHSEANSPDWVEYTDFMGELADGWNIDAPAEFATDKRGKDSGFEWRTTKGDDLTPPARLIRGKIPLIYRNPKIKFEFVETKDIWADVSFTDQFDRIRFIQQRILTTVGEAEKMGFDPKLLESASLNNNEETMSQLAQNGLFVDERDINSTDPKERRIYRYETYLYSSIPDSKGETKLYQVNHTDSEILDYKEVGFIPFIHAKAKNVVGSFYAQGLFDSCRRYQDALTKRYRQIDQVADKTSWPQYAAVKGAYDRQSLMNNRPGSVIEMQDVNAVRRFEPLALDPAVVKSYEILRESEQRRLRRGFGTANLEEIPPIATATVAMALFSDGLRGLPLSNSFADTLIKPMYKMAYNIMKDEGWPMLDQNGQPVEGFVYPDIVDITLDINTPGDDAAQVMQLQNGIQTAAVLAQINTPWLSDANKYESIKAIYQRSDLDVDKLLTDPATLPPDPHKDEMQKQFEACNAVLAKMAIQREALEQWSIAADVVTKREKIQETILDGANKRAIEQQESLTRQHKVMTDAEAKANKNEIENKRVNYDAILNAQEKRHDNQANGIM
ncbi:hypothetical protein VAA96_004548 [Salmonella enterica]|nr:hypothetical protein [Salmonella enterica]